MITVLRAQGLQIAIYLNDHPPPHVHVYGDGHLKIILAGANGRPELAEAEDMKKGDIRKALRMVADHRERLLHLWSEIHG